MSSWETWAPKNPDDPFNKNLGNPGYEINIYKQT